MEELANSINFLVSKIEKNEEKQSKICYTPKEIADILSISLNSVYNMIQSGVLEAFTIGNKGSKKPVYRISKQALDKYMKDFSTIHSTEKEVPNEE